MLLNIKVHNLKDFVIILDELSQNLSQLELDDSGTSQEDGTHRGRYSQDNEVSQNKDKTTR